MPLDLDSLNPAQREAAEHNDGPLLILAGAGSGKTRVLVHRIARLLEEGRARPWEILAVTFTNKAARELVERCRSMVGDAADELWVGTFHGMGARLLRRHCEELGCSRSFTIMDGDDQLKIARDVITDARLDPAVLRPETLRNFIENAKHEARSPADEEARGASDDLVPLYAAYERRLRALDAMDFGDLITRVLELFRGAPGLLERYQQRFRYVLVDEYQDTNHAQYLLVSRLAAGHGNLCVVGDDDQSIYAWRGASLRNILEFERDFAGAKVVRLEQNYRSSGNIVAAAHGVIANNGDRKDKQLWTDATAGRKVHVVTTTDERDEARYIVAQAAEGDPGDVAVFYRTNAQSRAIEEELVRSRMRYVIVGGTRFYERREIKDLVAYLRFIANPRDEISLARVINVPTRGIGRTTWERLIVEARNRDGTVWDLLEGSDPLSFVSPAPRRRLNDFRVLARRWLAMDRAAVTPLLEAILEDTAYEDHLHDHDGDDSDSRIENVHELLTVSQEFDEEYDEREFADPDDNADDADPTRFDPVLGALAVFLERLALNADVDSYEEQGGHVTLMTLHNSKGLEFDRVFIAGAEEGVFPHARSMAEDGRGLEEERRLCYVGVTRARRQLSLLHASRRSLYGTLQENLPSRFLDELPAAVVERIVTPRRSTRGGMSANRGAAAYGKQGYGGQGYGGARKQNAQSDTTPASRSYARQTWAEGARVVHPMFGAGRVSSCSGSGDSEKVEVRFDQVGLKRLVVKFAKLEAV
ncbi:MAG: UvrD-helicase domain-containing protein [Deltaproteobacteria bacterium]|nr:UvrD-helicase domain-containing protein [Deltaproteobacteria bacterium]